MSSLNELKENNPVISKGEKILVTGGMGQVAGFIVPVLQKLYGKESIIVTDVGERARKSGITELDVTDYKSIRDIIKDNKVKVVVHLAALLSAEAEKKPELAKLINEQSPKEIINIAKEEGVRQVIIPSSIAALVKNPDIQWIFDHASNNNSPEFLMNSNPHIKEDFDKNPFQEVGLEPAKFDPGSNYGRQKKALEEYALSQCNDSFRVIMPRYPGIFTCNVPPSNGTTEELDKFIVAQAEYSAYQNIKRIFGDKAAENISLTVANKDGKYYPKIGPDDIFPMMDGRAAGTETVRMMHAPFENLKGHETHYHMAEEFVNFRDVIRSVVLHLSKKYKGVEAAKRFLNVQFLDDAQAEKHYGNDKDGKEALESRRFKIDISNKWVDFTNPYESSKDFGYEQKYTLNQTVADFLVTRTEQFEQKFLKEIGEHIDFNAYKKQKDNLMHNRYVSALAVIGN